MLKFKAKAFYEVTTAMQHTLTMLEADNATSTRMQRDGSVVVMFIQDPVLLREIAQRTAALRDLLIPLEVPVTLLALEELRETFANAPTLDSIRDGYADIGTTLKRELDSVTLLALAPHEKQWFEPKEPLFGRAFRTKFPSHGAFELDEAAKCLALGRPTAGVFHLMRLMEVGIKAASKCLNIPAPTKEAERNWGKMLQKIDDEIKRRNGTVPKDWTVPQEADLFSEIYALLQSVRVAWRNTTMHVENKYTDDEAKHIFSAVKGFMTKLSSRMDEDGAPLA